MRLSSIHNRNPYTGKTTSLYDTPPHPTPPPTHPLLFQCVLKICSKSPIKILHISFHHISFSANPSEVQQCECCSLLKKWGFITKKEDMENRHDEVIKWKHFPCYWPFVRGIHHKGQWCGALMFSLTYAWINGWVNHGEAGDLRCHHTHCDVTVM